MIEIALNMLVERKAQLLATISGLACLFLLSASQIGLLVGWCNTTSAIIRHAVPPTWDAQYFCEGVAHCVGAYRGGCTGRFRATSGKARSVFSCPQNRLPHFGGAGRKSLTSAYFAATMRAGVRCMTPPKRLP